MSSTDHDRLTSSRGVRADTAWPVSTGPLPGQARRLRRAQALARRPPRRPRLGPQPGRSADGPGRYRRCPPRPALDGDHDPGGLRAPAPGPHRPGLGRAVPAGPVVGRGLHVWILAGFVSLSFLTDWGHLPLAG